MKVQVPCNWAQILEGAIDSAHSSSLHSTNMPSAEVDGAGTVYVVWQDCRFRTRCWKAQQRCAEEEPALIDRGYGHPVACHFPEVVDLGVTAR